MAISKKTQAAAAKPTSTKAPKAGIAAVAPAKLETTMQVYRY
jgi:hypothetical protein